MRWGFELVDCAVDQGLAGAGQDADGGNQRTAQRQARVSGFGGQGGGTVEEVAGALELGAWGVRGWVGHGWQVPHVV